MFQSSKKSTYCSRIYSKSVCYENTALGTYADEKRTSSACHYHSMAYSINRNRKYFSYRGQWKTPHKCTNSRKSTINVTRPASGNVREAASALEISTATVHRILRKCLFIYPYRLRNFHGLQSSDKIKRL